MSDQEEVQAAFRAELSKRLRGSLGPNERVVLSLTRLPGLSTVEGARDTARILRAIAGLLDAAGAPESMGQQFVDNLVAAAIGSRLRRPVEPWGGADTLDLLVEMQARQAGVENPEAIRRELEQYIDRQSVSDEPSGSRKGVSALFGRRTRS